MGGCIPSYPRGRIRRNLREWAFVSIQDPCHEGSSAFQGGFEYTVPSRYSKLRVHGQDSYPLEPGVETLDPLYL
jgi:hypothetical protein